MRPSVFHSIGVKIGVMFRRPVACPLCSPSGKTLAAQMLTFKATISASGHDSYNAGSANRQWREGAHYDFVLAVTVACWYAKSAPKPSFLLLDW